MRASLSSGLALAAALVLPACGASGDGDRSDLLVLFTGTINGYVEPCGCVAGQIGGIDRLAGYVSQELALHPDALFVDTGDLVGEELELDEAVLEQLPHKAEAFVSTFAEVGVEAIAVGETDLALLGVDELRALSERYDVPFLCGNLVDAKGNYPFPSYTIVERGGRRIGIFSLLAPKLTQAKVKEAGRVDVVRELAKQDLTLLDWRDRAQAIVDELLPKTDLILCASHLGYDLNVRLAKRYPQVDAVFGGHFGDAPSHTNVVGRTPVLVSLVRGSRVHRLEWWWPDEGAYFVGDEERGAKGNGRVEDVSSWVDADLGVDLQRHEYEGMIARELAHDPEEYGKLVADKYALLDMELRERAGLPPVPEGNRFSHVPVPMHRDLPRSPDALEAVDAYHEAVHAMWTARNANVEGERESPVFVGPERCMECHPQQVEFWRATRHSFALTALEATRQEVDAECFPCHTVGWRAGGGFQRPGRHEGFENVQCAACHGPTGNHVLGGASYVLPGLLERPTPATCQRCHNEEHDPKFSTQSVMVQRFMGATCPPMEPPAERLPLMREAAAVGAQTLLAQEPPNWALVSDAFLKADQPKRSLAAVEAWHRDQPANLDARILLGEHLLAADRTEEARQHFELATKRRPTNARAWKGLALALALAEPERSLAAAREAYSLEPNNPLNARLVVEILVRQGRVGSATELAAGFVESYPTLRRVFEGLVELPELPGPDDGPGEGVGAGDSPFVD